MSKWYWDVCQQSIEFVFLVGFSSLTSPRPPLRVRTDHIGMEYVATLILPVELFMTLILPPPHPLVALDYPPFFAYFEFLLSLPARLIDKRIVDLNNLNYSEWSVIAYQRSTVIITELVLGAALIRCARSIPALSQ